MPSTNTHRIALLLLLSFISFYIGYITNVPPAPPLNSRSRHITSTNEEDGNIPTQIKKCYNYNFFSPQCIHDNKEIHRRVQQILYYTPKDKESNENTIPSPQVNESSQFLTGSTILSKHELMTIFDNFGVATLNSTGSEDALLIYNSYDALPSNYNYDYKQMGTQSALNNCATLNVQFTNNPSLNTYPMCTLYIPTSNNLPSYHIQRYMRFNSGQSKGRLNHVGSLTTPKGVNKFDLPKYTLISKHWMALRTFLENVDQVLEEIHTLIQTRFSLLNEVVESVTVMTVNHGDVDLLINFLCGAKSRGLDVRRILVFVTDQESKRIIESLSNLDSNEMGVMVYYDKYNMASLAKGESQKYGDGTFVSMMFAKVLCVLYVSLLGYDVLYQDVDVIWYDDPMEFVRGMDREYPNLADYDVIFQHDGSPQPRFAPYSANSGFYYVKSNDRTQYLFISLLYHGDLIRKTTSHQAVLTRLLSEHSSLFGLKVKVLDDTYVFPGGYQYHYNHEYMHQLLSGEVHPYIFHMYWTDGKQSKIKFLQQFGEWYVNDDCLGGSSGECCSVEPIVVCHYRDKPSKIPCVESPLFDKNGRSFW